MTRPEAMVFVQDNYGPMSAAKLQRHLAERGVNVSRRTVAAWADPDRERALEAARRRRRRAEQHAMRLRDAGLTYESIAVVMGLYHDLHKSPDSWRALLRGLGAPPKHYSNGNERRVIRKAAA